MLADRAFPDGGVRPWRRRMALTFAVAVLLSFVGEPFLAVLLLGSAAPTLVRYVRRELALGALMAEARANQRQLARIPSADLREGSSL